MDSGEEKGKASIPKFASFKPQAQPVLPSRESKNVEARDRDHDRSRREDRFAHRSKHDTPSSRKARERHASPPADRKGRRDHESSRSVGPRVPDQDESDLFTIDRIGDKYNVKYGAPNQYSIPLYHRVGAGRVLGLHNNRVIDREMAHGNKIVIHLRGSTGGAETGRQKSSTSAWRTANKVKEFRRIRSSGQPQSGLENQQNFIPLAFSGSRKRRKIDNGDTSEEDSMPNYRSIEGKAKPTVDSDSEDDAGSDSGLESEEGAARRRNAALSAHVSAHPDDIDGWIELINHQGNLVGTADSEGRRIYTSAESRSIADIKISIYERALSKISANAPRDRLFVGMIEEGAAIWDTKTLSDTWKKILRSNPGYITLWVKYLDFQQTRFASFTFENCRAVFLECLSINRTQNDTFQRGVINIYILLRLSLFMRESGFIENAVALWQAILEFNFCRPKNLGSKNNSSAAAESFSEFWNSEALRLGEPGAKGWDNAENEFPTTKSDPLMPAVDTNAVFDFWIKSEQLLMHHSCLPARTLDEVQEDDPYRVILSFDISEFLISFPEDGLLNLLIDAFLLFCHLPPLPGGGNADVLAKWCEDPFIRNIVLDQANASSQWFNAISHTSEDSDMSTVTSFPYPNFAVNEDNIFSDGSCWFSAFQSWKATYVDGAGPLDVQWARRVLRQLVDRTPQNDDLAIYSVGLEYVCNSNSVVKYAKGLLRKRPSNVRLYNAYALIESRRGQSTSAEKVWTTTLSMSKSFSEEDGRNCVLLWRTWLWEALKNDNVHKATRLLLAIPENSIDVDQLSREAHTARDLSPAGFLKVQRVLVTSQEHGLTFRSPTIFTNSTDCLALLLYLTRDFSIESAMRMYRTAAEQLQSNSLEKTYLSELLHQSKAQFLWHHISKTKKYKPALVREELSASLTLFPHNTIFLCLFAYNESRFRIDDRVRVVLRQHIHHHHHHGSDDSTTNVLGQSILTPHFFSIYSELHRSVSAGSTAHSARAAFEAAVSSRSGQYSAALWKLFVLFELALGQKERARNVFYRSVRSCPWAKELVLLAFREDGLKEMMGMGELRKVWNILVGKGLRVHVDLGDVLDQMEDDEERKSISGDESGGGEL